MKRLLALLPIILILAACSAAHPFVNRPIARDEPVLYDGLAQVFDPSRLRELLVVANFSGGGSRSSAFAWAVVSELDRRRLVWNGRETTLARELDMVTGVSGGAITAAHIALHGVPEHLESFKTDFLAIDFQRRLTRSVISPSNWRREASPYFGRGHMLAEQLDTELFRGVTFRDLSALPHRPYLIVAATDLSTGAEFDFTKAQLAALCSSIDQIPVAFAVASSSAVPALFTPLSLESYREDCPSAVAARDSHHFPVAREESGALQPRRFIHLVDGGVADDLGAHRIADFIAEAGGIGAVFAKLGEGQRETRSRPRGIVFISVNSERRGGLSLDQSGKVPGAFEVINAMLYSGLGRQSQQATRIFHHAVESWRAELAAATLPGEFAGVDIYNIEIRLSELEDAKLRERALAIPTAFKISEEDLAVLRQAARQGLEQSAEYQRFLRKNRGDVQLAGK